MKKDARASVATVVDRAGVGQQRRLDLQPTTPAGKPQHRRQQRSKERGDRDLKLPQPKTGVAVIAFAIRLQDLWCRNRLRGHGGILLCDCPRGGSRRLLRAVGLLRRRRSGRPQADAWRGLGGGFRRCRLGLLRHGVRYEVVGLAGLGQCPDRVAGKESYQ